MAPGSSAALSSLTDQVDSENEAELDAKMLRPEQLYMATKTRHKLLNAAEEVALAKQIAAGGIAGNKAHTRFVECNQGLVVQMVRKYFAKLPPNSGMTFMDLIQEGNIGLLKAIEKFDYQRGYKFSTSATWWIMQAVQRAIQDQCRLIRFPNHLQSKLHRVFEAQIRLSEDLGREPTLEELAEETHLSLAQLDVFGALPVVSHSLDYHLSDDSELTLADIIADPGATTEEEAIQELGEYNVLSAMRRLLSAREFCVLQLRFGLDDDRSHTLEEIGQKFNVSRERIRQVEAKAIRKLQRSPRLRALYKEPLDLLWQQGHE